MEREREAATVERETGREIKRTAGDADEQQQTDRVEEILSEEASTEERKEKSAATGFGLARSFARKMGLRGVSLPLILLPGLLQAWRGEGVGRKEAGRPPRLAASSSGGGFNDPTRLC